MANQNNQEGNKNPSKNPKDINKKGGQATQDVNDTDMEDMTDLDE
jgi:hypothetical protein